jgi:hypothetical protein
MEIQTQEARIILALEAIRLSKRINTLAAAKLYRVPRSTLLDRMAGRTPRNETRPNCLKLSNLEEDIIVRNILNPYSRGFATRLASVEDIANYILESRGAKRVSKL